jgi:hypothetical protein
MMRETARMLTRLGVMLLIMSLLLRPFIKTEANLVGDDLAMIVSALLVVATVLYARLTRD